MSVFWKSTARGPKASPAIEGDATRLWRRSWRIGLVSTLVFAVACGFVWRSVDQGRQNSLFVSEAAPMLGDIAELKGLLISEALRIAYQPEHARTEAHDAALRRMRARRFRIAERAGALSDLMSAGPAETRLSRAARLWWRPQGDGAAAEVARLLESSAAIGRSLGPDASTVAALGVLADRLAEADPSSLGARLGALAEEGRLIVARLAAEQQTTLERAGVTFLAALALYTALMMLVVLRPLARRVAADGAEAAAARYDASEHARAKKDFLGALSHELRTPLTAILGSADALATLALGSEGRPHVQVIQSSAGALRARIDDLLRLAGADRASAAADLVAAFEPGAHAVETAALVKAKAEAAGIDLAVSVDPALPSEVEGDAAALRKILLALLDNAVKFTRTGGVALRVSSVPTPLGLDDGDRTRIRYDVIDSGVGIAPEARERIFAPFEQEKGGLDRPADGAGLGLALARDMARALGGEIRVESVAGAGSCFTLELAFEPGVAVSSAGATAPAPLSGASILVIDGDTPAAAARVEHLRARGAEVAFARDAASAEQALGAGASAPSDVPSDIPSAPTAADATLPREKPILLVHETGDGALMADAAARLAGRVSAAARLGDPERAPIEIDQPFFADSVLDALDPGRWDETLQDLRLAPHAGGARRSGSTAAPAAVTATDRASDDAAQRVLVVDDESANRRVMSLAFARAGFAVDEARSGLEAVEMAAKRSYALATLDWRMDDIDGLETARRLRALDSPSARAALLLVTAEPQSVDRDEAEALGFAAVVAKPVNLAALVDLARQATARAQAA